MRRVSERRALDELRIDEPLLLEISPARYHCFDEKTHWKRDIPFKVSSKRPFDKNGRRERLKLTDRILDPTVETNDSTINAMNMKKICLLTRLSTEVLFTGAALKPKPKRKVSSLFPPSSPSARKKETHVAFLINFVSFPPTTTIP